MDLDPAALLSEMGRTAAIERVGLGSSPSVKPPKIRYTHEAMADLLLESPWMSQNALAEHFGYSPGWISTIITSDAFQSYYASRREELIDPVLRLSLQERFKALTSQSLKILQEKISKPEAEVDPQLALRCAELGAKSLGLGNAPPPPPPNDGFENLKRLEERILSLGRGQQAQPISDATLIKEVA